MESETAKHGSQTAFAGGRRCGDAQPLLPLQHGLPSSLPPEQPSSVSERNGADILGYVAVLGADVLGRKAFQSGSFFLAAVFSGLFQLFSGFVREWCVRKLPLREPNAPSPNNMELPDVRHVGTSSPPDDQVTVIMRRVNTMQTAGTASTGAGAVLLDRHLHNLPQVHENMLRTAS